MTSGIPKLERDLQALQSTQTVGPSVLLEVAELVATGPSPVAGCPTDEWAECRFEHRDSRDGVPCTYIALLRIPEETFAKLPPAATIRVSEL